MPRKKLSRTKQALKLVDAGMTAYAAAAKVGINRSAVTRGLQARERANSFKKFV